MCFILFLIRNFLEKCTIHDSYSKIQTREIFKGICQYAMYGYPQNRLFGLDGVVCHHKIYFPPLVYLLCHLCILAVLVLLSSISPLISCFLLFLVSVFRMVIISCKYALSFIFCICYFASNRYSPV